MKKALHYTLRLIVIFTTITLFSGCYMFHKKNRCGDCPKWKIEIPQNEIGNFNWSDLLGF